MKNLSAFIAAAGFAAPLLGQATTAAKEPCLHTRTSFDLMVNASLAEAAPLFGPNGERAWAGKDWNPEFIYPRPASDQEGAVFTVRHGSSRAVWVNTLFDIEGRHFQYVYFLPDLMVTVIDVHFKPLGAQSTAVNVVYMRTALTPGGNTHVRAMSDHDRTSGNEWQQAINEYLGRRTSAAQP